MSESGDEGGYNGIWIALAILAILAVVALM